MTLQSKYLILKRCKYYCHNSYCFFLFNILTEIPCLLESKCFTEKRVQGQICIVWVQFGGCCVTSQYDEGLRKVWANHWKRALSGESHSCQETIGTGREEQQHAGTRPAWRGFCAVTSARSIKQTAILDKLNLQKIWGWGFREME